MSPIEAADVRDRLRLPHVRLAVPQRARGRALPVARPVGPRPQHNEAAGSRDGDRGHGHEAEKQQAPNLSVRDPVLLHHQQEQGVRVGRDRASAAAQRRVCGRSACLPATASGGDECVEVREDFLRARLHGARAQCLAESVERQCGVVASGPDQLI